MSTYVNASRYRDVVRYHLVSRFNYAILPWAVLAFVFLIDVLVIELTPAGHTSHRWVGGLASVFVIGFVLGIQSAHRSLPFGLALGLSRRTYYLGTALLAVALAAIVGVLAAVGQEVERATNGWGINMGFFRVPYILNGPWYSTWLTSFVVLTFLYVYGMWVGLVYRRWNLIGMVAFVAAQVTVLVIAAIIVTGSHAWHRVGHFFTTVGAGGLTGLVAALAVVLLAGGFVTMRRVTV
ncbi:MAG TPA: hypothetical protein VGL75_10900 [Acidothermaceae bacterium]|jgi:hypothetical protein